MQLILVCMEDTELSTKKKDDCQDTTYFESKCFAFDLRHVVHSFVIAW